MGNKSYSRNKIKINSLKKAEARQHDKYTVQKEIRAIRAQEMEKQRKADEEKENNENARFNRNSTSSNSSSGSGSNAVSSLPPVPSSAHNPQAKVSEKS